MQSEFNGAVSMACPAPFTACLPQTVREQLESRTAGGVQPALTLAQACALEVQAGKLETAVWIVLSLASLAVIGLSLAL